MSIPREHHGGLSCPVRIGKSEPPHMRGICQSPASITGAFPARFGLASPNPRTCGGFVNPPRASRGLSCPVRIGKSEPCTCGGFVNPPRASRGPFLPGSDWQVRTPAHAGDLSIPASITGAFPARFGLASPNPRTCGGFVNPPRASRGSFLPGSDWQVRPRTCGDLSIPREHHGGLSCPVRIGKSEPAHAGDLSIPRASRGLSCPVRIGKSEPRTCGDLSIPREHHGAFPARFGLASPNPAHAGGFVNPPRASRGPFCPVRIGKSDPPASIMGTPILAYR
ncbi:hypothetical protein QUF80_23685 [Desulfococcaceae bacterium HSG8]|nr:hypothetical protein [Desulfococcaceae bacterium HSG8]